MGLAVDEGDDDKVVATTNAETGKQQQQHQSARRLDLVCATCQRTNNNTTTRLPFFQCANCRSVYYCSRECQRYDWNNNNNNSHRKVCKALRAKRELAQILQSVSRLQAEQEFYKATDAVSLCRRPKEEGGVGGGGSSATSTSSTRISSSANKTNKNHKQKTRQQSPPASLQRAKKHEQQPQGEKPQGEKPQGEKPQGEKPQAEKPQAEKPQAETPQAEKPQGEKPQAERHEQQTPCAYPIPKADDNYITTGTVQQQEVTFEETITDQPPPPNSDSLNMGNTISTTSNKKKYDIEFRIQHMPNLYCYQLQLLLLDNNDGNDHSASNNVTTKTTRFFALDDNDDDSQLSTPRLVYDANHQTTRVTLAVVVEVVVGNVNVDVAHRQQQRIPLSLDLPGEILHVSTYNDNSSSLSSPSSLSLSCQFRLAYQSSWSVDVSSLLLTKQQESLSSHSKGNNRFLPSLEAVSTLACRACRHPLVSNNNNINNEDRLKNNNNFCSWDRIAPLHSSRWQGEMLDYLICYPGQPVVDFSGTNNNTAVLEDDISIVLPRHDGGGGVGVEDNVNDTALFLDAQQQCCCVLAIPGYGEDPRDDDDNAAQAADESAARRGSRPWRDWIGGATLTCSNCASIVGYATLEQQQVDNSSSSASRLLKHRVVWSCENSSSNNNDNDAKGVSSSSTNSIVEFVAHEMARYADTKAIFAFQITCETSSSTGIATTATATPPDVNTDDNIDSCLFLRLLSWDTEAATGQLCMAESNDKNGNGNDEGGRLLCQPSWRRLVQVLYEESSTNIASSSSSSSGSGSTGSAVADQQDLQWMWTTNKDWCCPPATPPAGASASTDVVAKEEKTQQQQEQEEQSVNNLNNNYPPSIVRLFLSLDEYQQLRHSLQDASHFYSDEVKQATILAKTGRPIVNNSATGLAAILL